MNNLIQKLPPEIQHIILSFIRLNNSYIFNKDCVYFYIEPQIFTFEKYERTFLQMNIYGWFGVHKPNKYRDGRILHTVFERLYEITLERIFGVIAKNLYKDLDKFNLGNDIIETIYGDTTYAGTYGPLRNNILGNSRTNYFNSLSNICYCRTDENFITYFKDHHIIDENTYEITNEVCEYSTRQLKNLLNLEIIKSIKKYRKHTKNKIKGPFYKKGKLFFSISKPISDTQHVINKNMLRKLSYV